MNLLFIFLLALAVVIVSLFVIHRPKTKYPHRDIGYMLITNYGNLKLYAPHALEDLRCLAKIISLKSGEVTEEGLILFFKRGGTLAIAFDGGRMVGVASIVFVVRYNGISAQLENVAVLLSYQGYGIAKKLVGMLIVDVRMTGMVSEIDLTCRPERKAANHLYEKLGFKLRKTNARRLLVEDTMRS